MLLECSEGEDNETDVDMEDRDQGLGKAQSLAWAGRWLLASAQSALYNGSLAVLPGLLGYTVGR